ncbi:MAG: ATP synthase F1 subunit delta [Terriglobia bacterium]
MSLALARRYARALADVLFEEKLPPAGQRRQVRVLKEQLAQFAALLRDHAALRSVLASPAVPREEKFAVLGLLAQRLKLSLPGRNFLALLIEKRRLDLLGLILESFDTEIYRRLGIVPVEVTTAVVLAPKERKELEVKLRALTRAEVELRFGENPEILSGGVVRLGSTVYDGSLRVQLRRLQARLASE